MADIFIAYAQKDGAQVAPIARALEAEGWSVWWDPHGAAGEMLETMVERELREAGCVVVVWSSSSVESDWVLGEADEGRERRILVPIVVDEQRPPIRFRRFNTVSLAGWDGKRDGAAYSTLVGGVRRILGEPSVVSMGEPQAEREASVGSKGPTANEGAAPESKAGAPVEEDGQDDAAEPVTTRSPTPMAPRRAISWKALALVVVVLVGVVTVSYLAYERRQAAVAQAEVEARRAAVEEAQREARRTPGTIVRDTLRDGTRGPEMVVLAGGTFTMGSPLAEVGRSSEEGPEHEVTIAAFAIGRHEVTFDEYNAFARAAGRALADDDGFGRGARPVINVSWDDARAYAAWLSEQTGVRYRLPSESEWEYAARAGTTGPFWTGECIDTKQANYNGNYGYADCGKGEYRGQTLPVGSLPANAWGLHEVAGNVWEWIEDCWHEDYQGAPGDGSVWLGAGGGDCARRVVRGGSWNGYPLRVRSASRLWLTAGYRDGYLGFRLAQDL